MSDLGWFLAKTQGGRERWAAENIARQGAEFYLPRLAKPVKRGKLTEHRTELLFPNYIFARTSDGRWRFLLGTFGISYVIQSGDYPTPVPAKEIAKLRAREDEDGLIRLPEKIKSSKFVVDQRLRIKQGSFAGQVGLCQEMSPGERVRVLLSGMGRKVPVLIDEAHLEAA